jgi:hypothetical protein
MWGMSRVRLSLFVVALLGLVACNGKAVVTLTSTPSTDNFLTYRVGLRSIQLQEANGGRVTQILPSSTTVDLATLTNLSEVVGSSNINRGNYALAVITLDYSSAEIVYDNGTLDGLALTPRSASGRTLGTVVVNVVLDPNNQFSVARGNGARLSLDFNLAASNLVNVSQKTVTVTPLIAASGGAIDAKVVRVRGPMVAVDTSSDSITTGIMPFNFPTTEAGSLGATASASTAYEINGTPSTGVEGLARMSGLPAGVTTVVFGTLTSTTTTTAATDAGTTQICDDGTIPTTSLSGVATCDDGSTPTTTSSGSGDTTSTNLSFAATQVLAGSSVQGSGFDRVSGVVSARSGNVLSLEDATLLASDGTNTFLPATAIVEIGPNTQMTEFGVATPPAAGIQQISVGSRVDAFGTAGSVSSGGVTLDASAGRVRIDSSSAWGMVTTQGAGELTVVLDQLGGRSVPAFDFIGTGTSSATDASGNAYQIGTGTAGLGNATAGLPVVVSGLVTPFGAAPVDFTASSLLDYTTIVANLVIDYGAGTSAPFTYDTTQINIDPAVAALGVRHEIQVGPQVFNVVGSSTAPVIIPSTADTSTVFSIGHSGSGTTENFVTYASFASQLQTELISGGSVLATGITAVGQYTAPTFTATSITIFLNN